MWTLELNKDKARWERCSRRAFFVFALRAKQVMLK